ncbi:MAG: hypothetical protein E7417_01430 [Ruminococcaceae bacterium]|nr:hypothetical protein [Oscillospiraceae bacterium]
MKKEHFKNVILITLIITNFMLSQRIFADKKLWLFGYNFFSNIGYTQKNDDLYTTLNLDVPEKIFVNTGYQSSRFCYLRAHDNFEKIYSGIESAILKAFSSPEKNIAPVSEDMWYSVLTGKSFYIVFGGEYSSQLYANLLGVTNTGLNIPAFSHIAISEEGNFYIKDNKNNTYFRVNSVSNEIKTMIEQITTENENVESVINYSYELNFDKAFSDQKTFIAPLVAVYPSPLNSSTLWSENPLIKGEEINYSLIEKILSAFSINPNTVRRYTEADGTLVFVENNGILRISTDGTLNFTANDTGIKLPSGKSALVSLSQFIDTINSAYSGRNEMTITSSANTESTDYSFDYIIQGLPVKFKDKNAVNAKVSGGYLKEYTHILRKYTPTNNYIITPTFIESLDQTILSYQDSMKEIHIMKMYPAYNDSMIPGEIIQDWHIEINDIIAQ